MKRKRALNQQDTTKKRRVSSFPLLKQPWDPCGLMVEETMSHRLYRPMDDLAYSLVLLRIKPWVHACLLGIHGLTNLVCTYISLDDPPCSHLIDLFRNAPIPERRLEGRALNVTDVCTSRKPCTLVPMCTQHRSFLFRGKGFFVPQHSRVQELPVLLVPDCTFQ